MTPKETGRHVTIRQVAERAGVSAQTVSRVLNEKPDVARETRAKVRRTIAEMDYAPNVIARNLSLHSSLFPGFLNDGESHASRHTKFYRQQTETDQDAPSFGLKQIGYGGQKGKCCE